MNKFEKFRCLIVGAGKMGLAHAKVMSRMSDVAVLVWAPSKKRFSDFGSLGVDLKSSNLTDSLENFKPSHVIIASPVETLCEVASRIMDFGVREILVEKPAVIDFHSGVKLQQKAKALKANVFIGYNRRFYSSFQSVIKKIQNEKDVLRAIHFQFDEPFLDENPPKNQSKVALSRWVLSNSLHVIDSAFLATGLPEIDQITCYASGSLSWHEAGSYYAGFGNVGKNVNFSYNASWGTPGKWSVDWITSKYRYYFSPLEEVRILKQGSFDYETMALDNSLDLDFKPGLFSQNESFLYSINTEKLATLNDALKLVELGKKMGNY